MEDFAPPSKSQVAAEPRPALGFWQIWNMSFGFLGIQFGWALQMANMSSIYEYLGAGAHEIPMLWLAAPLTGLIVQPIIGHMSDRTWGRLGRRRPYFLVGAILASAALVAMPSASALWMAAGLLWILDASINISMEPFRAFVADLLPAAQRTRGFAMQALFIGLGSIIASALPWFLHRLGVNGSAIEQGAVPDSVKLSFYLGAVVFLGAVLFTIATTREYPPDDLRTLRELHTRPRGARAMITEIWLDFCAMPKTMRGLAWVQIFTWLGLFCMWLYLGVAIAHSVFHGTPGSAAYGEGIAWGGVCFATYSAVCFLFSFAIPGLASRLGRKLTHALCLLAGAAGLISVAFIHGRYLLLISMAFVGIAWASVLSIPYSILSTALPNGKTGVYMGIFNFFIVIPEILAALFFGKIMERFLTNDSALVQALGGDNRLAVVALGGVSLALAAALLARVAEPHPAQGIRPDPPAPLSMV